MGYVYSRNNVKQFAKSNANAAPSQPSWAKTLGMSVASMAAVQVVNMLVNQIADSISNGDFERAFIKFKNNNAFKRIIENAKEAKQLKIDSKVTVDNLQAGDKIRSVIADSEFLIDDVLHRNEDRVTVMYTLTNPEEIGIDKDSIKNSSKVTLTAKDLKFFNKVI